MISFRLFWRLYRRRLPLVLCFTALGCLVGAWAALLIPGLYRAEAVLVVEAGQVSNQLASSTVQTGDIEALEIIRQRLLSRSTLLALADDLGIYAELSAFSDDERVVDLRKRIEITTRGGQVGRAARDATIVTVGFSASKADMAAATANRIAALLMQANVDSRVSVARQTLDFFVAEVAEGEAALETISREILDFQDKNPETLPDSLDFRRSQRAGLQERLVQLERQQAALRDRRDLFLTRFDDFEATGADHSRQRSAPLNPAEQRLADLGAEQALLAPVLSKDNPRMILLQARIAAAQTEVDALPPSMPAATQAPGSRETQLADLDSQIAHLDEQRRDIQAQIAHVTRTIEATPHHAAILAKLERSFANVQSQYNQSVANQARAQTGRTIEASAQGQRISVVQPAVAPQTKSGPPRMWFTIGGAIAGLAFAIAAIVMLDHMDHQIRRPVDIEKALGIKVLVTLPFMEAQSQSRAGLVVGAMVALAVFGAVQHSDNRSATEPNSRIAPAII